MNPKRQKFVKQLTNWYEKEGRHELPWRSSDTSPFHILIAEFLLQQTQAEQVIPVYQEFIKRYPKPENVKKAKKEDIDEVIGVLGLSYRTDRIKEACKILDNKYDGSIPADIDKLKELPGVGDYIAHSVAIHSFGKSYGVVDTNTSRIVSRVFGKEIKGRARNSSELWEFMHTLTPESRSSEFTYAMLDLGSIVCTSSEPSCSKCPLNNICEYYNG